MIGVVPEVAFVVIKGGLPLKKSSLSVLLETYQIFLVNFRFLLVMESLNIGVSGKLK
ncbi:MAG: hypothetical protein Q9M11_07885 [Mariprofundaceae bacterium]|nr:hypothetical protein [Mariprofundaceae bacterium]